MIKKKSPLKQEDPKPTYSNMPTSKRSGFKDRPYTATKKDSANYKEGFNNPNKLTTNMFKTAGRMEAIKARKSPLKQEDPKKAPYVPGRVSKEVRAAADAKKAIARQKMESDFVKRAADKNMTREQYGKYTEKRNKGSREYQGTIGGGGYGGGGKGSGAKCPNMPG
jgi:hypothetical protein